MGVYVRVNKCDPAQATTFDMLRRRRRRRKHTGIQHDAPGAQRIRHGDLLDAAHRVAAEPALLQRTRDVQASDPDDVVVVVVSDGGDAEFCVLLRPQVERDVAHGREGGAATVRGGAGLVEVGRGGVAEGGCLLC